MTHTIRVGARLRASRKAAGFKTSKEFIKKHKVPASTYSQHESGARTPDDEALRFYSKIFGVNFDWLAEGKGQPFSKSTTIQKSAMDEELLDISGQKNTRTKDLDIINQKLLAKLLEEMIVFHQSSKAKTTPKSIAKNVASLYTVIVTKYRDNKTQGEKKVLNAYKSKHKM